MTSLVIVRKGTSMMYTYGYYEIIFCIKGRGDGSSESGKRYSILDR